MKLIFSDGRVAYYYKNSLHRVGSWAKNSIYNKLYSFNGTDHRINGIIPIVGYYCLYERYSYLNLNRLVL